MTDFKSKVFELIIKYAIPISLPSSFPKPACPVIVSLYGFLWKWVKPLIIINLRRMAGHIFTNYGKIQTIEWILGALGFWLGLVTTAMGYMIKNCKCRVRKGRPANVREVLERAEEGRPLRNNQ